LIRWLDLFWDARVWRTKCNRSVFRVARKCQRNTRNPGTSFTSAGLLKTSENIPKQRLAVVITTAPSALPLCPPVVRYPSSDEGREHQQHNPKGLILQQPLKHVTPSTLLAHGSPAGSIEKPAGFSLVPAGAAEVDAPTPSPTPDPRPSTRARARA